MIAPVPQPGSSQSADYRGNIESDNGRGNVKTSEEASPAGNRPDPKRIPLVRTARDTSVKLPVSDAAAGLRPAVTMSAGLAILAMIDLGTQQRLHFDIKAAQNKLVRYGMPEAELETDRGRAAALAWASAINPMYIWSPWIKAKEPETQEQLALGWAAYAYKNRDTYMASLHWRGHPGDPKAAEVVETAMAPFKTAIEEDKPLPEITIPWQTHASTEVEALRPATAAGDAAVPAADPDRIEINAADNNRWESPDIVQGQVVYRELPKELEGLPPSGTDKFGDYWTADDIKKAAKRAGLASVPPPNVRLPPDLEDAVQQTIQGWGLTEDEAKRLRAALAELGALDLVNLALGGKRFVIDRERTASGHRLTIQRVSSRRVEDQRFVRLSGSGGPAPGNRARPAELQIPPGLERMIQNAIDRSGTRDPAARDDIRKKIIKMLVQLGYDPQNRTGRDFGVSGIPTSEGWGIAVQSRKGGTIEENTRLLTPWGDIYDQNGTKIVDN